MKVYLITNLRNQKRYVGSTTGPARKRWSEHRCRARRGCHSSPHFQHAWNKYGSAAFRFEVIEEGPWTNAEMLAREQHYIDTLRPEYNVCVTAGNRTGMPTSAATRAKIAQSLRRGFAEGRFVPARLGAPVTAETRALLRRANLGKVRTPESRAKASLALRNLPKSDAWKREMSILRKRLFAEGVINVSVRTGWHHSEVTKAKIRTARARQVDSPETKAKRVASIAAHRALHGWTPGVAPVQGPKPPPKPFVPPMLGRQHSEETKEKQRQAAIGRVMSPEARAKMSAAWAAKRAAKEAAAPPAPAPGMTGKHHSDEAKEKMRQGHLGKTLTDEHRQKLSDAHKGQVFSPEHRQHLAEARQRTVARKGAELAEQPPPPPPPSEMLEEQPLPPPPAPEEVEPFHHTPETRQKISEIRTAYWAERHAADPTLGQRPHKERVISEETKERMRQRFAGIPLSEEHKAKLKIARQGRVYTEATRLKMAESRRRVAAEQRARKAAAEAASAGAPQQ